MKKIIRNIVLGFLIFSNSFAMEISEPKKEEDTSFLRELKNMAIVDKKEAEEFYSDIFKKSQQDRAENILDQKAYLRENFDFLRIEQAIKGKNEQITALFFYFISQKLNSMIDKKVLAFRPGDISYEDFKKDLSIDLYSWIIDINEISDLSLSVNLVALIYLRRIQAEYYQERLTINNVNRYFFISYVMAQRFLEDSNYKPEDLDRISFRFFGKQLISRMTEEFFALLHFNLSVPDEEFKALCHELVEFIKINSDFGKKN